MNDTFSQIARAIQGAGHIAIACHIRPDGDAIGSIVGMALSLQLSGKKVTVICEDGVPANLRFLPGSGMVQVSQAEPLDIDVAIALDNATKERLGARTNIAFSAAPILINMDHHGTNPRYGTLNYIDTQSPATGQIVYEFLRQHGFEFNDAVRQNLFVAISTDTGSFQYNSTTAQTHRIVAEMMDAGLDTADLAQKVYQTHPFRRTQLLRVLLNEMKFTADRRIASWALTLATQREIGVEAGDTEGLIDHLRTIEGVMSAVVFEETPDGNIRVSARSKDPRLNVSKICAEYGGGGHVMAAGARLPGPVAEAEFRFLESLKNEIERIG
ncbi:MAG: hypothetical protein RL693_683 [Verrucomicrobiota bacterium]